MTAQSHHDLKGLIHQATTPLLPPGFSMDFRIVEDDPEEVEPPSQKDIGAMIQALTCSFFKLTPKDILKRDRHGNIVVTRNALCLMLKKYTRLTLKEISDMAFSKTDHTAVKRGILSLTNRMDTEPEMKIKITQLNHFLLTNIKYLKYDA